MNKILRAFRANDFMSKATKSKNHLHFVAAQNKKDKEFDGAQARSKERAKTRRARLLKGD